MSAERQPTGSEGDPLEDRALSTAAELGEPTAEVEPKRQGLAGGLGKAGPARKPKEDKPASGWLSELMEMRSEAKGVPPRSA